MSRLAARKLHDDIKSDSKIMPRRLNRQMTDFRALAQGEKKDVRVGATMAPGNCRLRVRSGFAEA